MSGWRTRGEVHFVSLQGAVFCAQCELISQNSTPQCLACGSRALVSLARLLGGTLHGQTTARLIEDRELNQLIRELIGSVPAATEERKSLPLRCWSRPRGQGIAAKEPEHRHLPQDQTINLDELDLEPTISLIAERAQAITAATGAALALRYGDEIICRARAGRTAPDLGVRLETDSGISAQCVRTGEILVCGDTERNPWVNRAICRQLGIRSILVAPLRHLRRTLGLFEVLSSAPHAFDQQDAATMQMLAGITVAAIGRRASEVKESRQTGLSRLPF